MTAPAATRRNTTSEPPLTLAELCAELKISPSTFHDWRAKKKAPRCIKLPNGELRIRRSVLDNWINDREESA